jgi:DnaJ domain
LGVIDFSNHNAPLKSVSKDWAGKAGAASVMKRAMARRPTRTNDWGFPRWREYGSERDAVKVRVCDRHGCTEPGDRPAPKSPNSPERWYFCLDHATEYNRGWDYFEGLSKEEAAAREAQERSDYSGYKETQHYGWTGPGDGSRSREEMRALDLFGLESDAAFEHVRSAWRKMAKEHHPDVKPGDSNAAKMFQAIQAAYEVLKSAEERRLAL